MKQEFLKIRLEEFNFLLKVDQLSEIFFAQKIFSVPLMSEDIIGTSSIHGKIVVIFSLKKLLDIKYSETSNEPKYILFELKEENYAFFADEVGEKVSIEEEKIFTTVDNLNVIWSKNASGYTKIDNKVIVILDLNKIIDNLLQRNL